MWTGLRTWDMENWKFQNGGAVAEYTNWANDQPNSGSCSVIKAGGVWSSSDCTNAVCICEIQVGEWPSPPPAPPPPNEVVGIAVAAAGSSVGVVALLGLAWWFRVKRQRRIAHRARAASGEGVDLSRKPREAISVEQPDGQHAVGLA